MSRAYYSHGKLLLTAEYGVLDGALALALPTRKGQHMRVSPKPGDTHSWTALSPDGTPWFRTSFSSEEIRREISIPKERPERKKLIQLLKAARELNPRFLDEGAFDITTLLEFPGTWGLGSSSTLVNNVAQWSETNAFELLRRSFGGSGYDIACAQSSGPILYQVSPQGPAFTEVPFRPPFLNSLHFVYMNRKQDSREGVAAYRAGPGAHGPFVRRLTDITQAILELQRLEEFEEALADHEALVSGVLGRPTVKELYFPDFPGGIKSLGAWGGDFILATGGQGVVDYFRRKGYHTVLSYPSLIL